MNAFRAALVMVSCFIGGAVVADEPAPAKGEHPCRKIESACAAAGFVNNGAVDGKGMFRDCIKPILDGKPVAGVTPGAADVQACVTARAKHAQHARPASAEQPAK